LKNYLLLPILLFFIACTVSETERRKANAVNQPLPDQKAKDVEIIHSEQGIKKVKITAPELVMRDTPKEQLSEFPIGVAITFFDKKGEETANLTAKFGQDNAKKRERYVRDSVIIKTIKNEIIETDELFMNDAKDSIYNNGKFVKYTSPTRGLIQGYGLLADAGFTNVRILSVFDSQIIVDGEENTTTSPQPMQRPTNNLEKQGELQPIQ